MADPILAALNELRAELAEMRAGNDALVSGLTLLNESVGALTEMVSTVVGVLTQDEPDTENATAKALNNLAQAVNRTGLQVGQLREAMAGASLRGAVVQPTPPAH